MKFFSNGESVFSKLTIPEHLSGWKNLAHGGVISTVLDEIMGWSAIYLLKKFVLTKSISVEFLKPVHIGHEIKAKGRLVEIKSEREALMEGVLLDGQNNVCAKSTGVFAVFSLDAAKRLQVIDMDHLEELESFFGKEPSMPIATD
jgi:uncharacterized protein (TIGR00369 family)